ncbi:hypothetical protein UF16_09795 [Chromobacterium violaceum]|nr:hypothetical protein UF16_09795 [Chromobacterium violaceum]
MSAIITVTVYFYTMLTLFKEMLTTEMQLGRTGQILSPEEKELTTTAIATKTDIKFLELARST